MEQEIHVKCPHCRNKRLFDIKDGAKGTVKIKCPICKSVVEIQLDKIHTE